ncbi:MAG TPA: dienelactone hydrolase family protein [Candidatus Baltobacteraceae bacterium]|nr:dienelactone hydrolase family protein [Candidatus Baltobacteraceae bacterium]
MGQMIEFTRPDGKTAPAFLAVPEKDAQSAPGIVVVAEWWGITPDIMETASEYAALGYRALVPDLFRGRTAAVGDEANHLMEGLDFQDAFSQDVRGALAYLKQNGKKAGVTGYCMGGAIAMLSAMHLKEPDAAVIFYGFPGSEGGDPATIEIPIQCHFAKHDDFFTPQRGGEIEKRMKEGKVPCEVFWYEAKHAFCNPNQPGNAGLGHYDAKAAHEAWERTVAFWKNTLH